MNILAIIVAIIVIPLVSANAQNEINPSLDIVFIEVPAANFDTVARDAERVILDDVHSRSWQVTIQNDLEYTEEGGGAVLRIYDAIDQEKFVEFGMGAPSNNMFWVAVNIPDAEGYVPIHSMTERGWSPSTKVIAAYTDRAGMTINNGQRIVVSNLDIDEFAIGSYSVYGAESYLDGTSVESGTYSFEIISGDPSENAFHLFPFFVTAAVGVLVGVLFLTKKRR